MGYTRSFFTGLAWNGGIKIGAKFLTLIKLAFLARLLTPHDFGLFSLVLVSVSLVEVFTESGINTILVQSQKKIEYYLDTAWVFSIGRGLLITLVTFLMAFIMSAFYNEAGLFHLLLLACFVPFIRGFINPAIVTMYKDLSFRKDSYYRFSLSVMETVSAILLAYWLRSSIALIVPIIFSSLLDLVLSFTFVTIRPQLKYRTEVLKEIFQSSKWLNQISIMDYLNKNIDDLMIGRILGTDMLGFYRNAYALTQSATADLGQSVMHASFPIFSKFQDDPSRLSAAIIKVIGSFAVFLVLPLVVLTVIPETVVQIILGAEWLPIIPLVPLLAIAGYIQGVFNIGNTIFTVKKQYSSILTVLGISLVTLVGSIIWIVPTYGLLGTAICVLLSRCIALPFFLFFLAKAVKTTT